MSPCPVPTKAGNACPNGVGSRGLCHVHDPDAAFALQDPRRRARLLARPEVLAVLQQGPGPATTARPAAKAITSRTPVVKAPVRAAPAPGSYVAELEFLVDRARRVIAEVEESPPSREWAIRARRWREEADAARGLARPRARGEGDV